MIIACLILYFCPQNYAYGNRVLSRLYKVHTRLKNSSMSVNAGFFCMKIIFATQKYSLLTKLCVMYQKKCQILERKLARQISGEVQAPALCIEGSDCLCVCLFGSCSQLVTCMHIQ